VLSHEDRRRLAAIERRLLDDDPAFVRRFRRRAAAAEPEPWSIGRLNVLTVAMLAVVGSMALVGLLVMGVTAVLLAIGCTVAAVVWFRRRRR
jgi:hypothetical protein